MNKWVIGLDATVEPGVTHSIESESLPQGNIHSLRFYARDTLDGALVKRGLDILVQIQSGQRNLTMPTKGVLIEAFRGKELRGFRIPESGRLKLTFTNRTDVPQNVYAVLTMAFAPVS